MCNATAPVIVDSSEVKTEQPENMINAGVYFPTMIYDLQKPEYLEVARSTVKEALDLVKKKIKFNPLYPVYQTESLLEGDSKIRDLLMFIAQTGFHILQQQGYAMEHVAVNFIEAWCQEHHKYSSMEQHIHGGNAQLIGFYFIDVPENSSLPVFHDPRAGKNQVTFMENDVNGITPATTGITIQPKEGMLVFANSWLPHSFTRNGSDKPFRFIHFTLGIQAAPPEHEPEVEIV
jgi:Putative 2OG-Fe(II) oxygenase